ncbi:conserved hypothetical protein [Frankia canadensis]|uniref:Uncharacterized protein n=1 Tax=Frankia canadensis TaxID=1836972 RepID=A0A2I2KTN6_9ACTN|nr:conserved hypothetical protein [Frankia canadensis]SOU56323.1 conserved hypothetical protein [Frankia canadensis]
MPAVAIAVVAIAVVAIAVVGGRCVPVVRRRTVGGGPAPRGVRGGWAAGPAGSRVAALPLAGRPLVARGPAAWISPGATTGLSTVRPGRAVPLRPIRRPGHGSLPSLHRDGIIRSGGAVLSRARRPWRAVPPAPRAGSRPHRGPGPAPLAAAPGLVLAATAIVPAEQFRPAEPFRSTDERNSPGQPLIPGHFDTP